MTATRRFVDKRCIAAGARGDLLGGRGEGRVEIAADEDVDDVEAGEQQARDDAGHE